MLSKYHQPHIDVKNRQIPMKKQTQFLKRLSALLNEGYTFHSSLVMLLPHHVKSIEAAQNHLSEQLKSGEGVTSILAGLGIPNNYLLSVQLAESHGKLHQALLVLHTHMAMVERAKASLKKVVMYPLFLFVMLTGLFLAFRTYFLPNMKILAMSRQSSTSAETMTWTKILMHLPDYLVVCCLLILVLVGLYRWRLGKYPMSRQVDVLQKTPLISKWSKLTLTRNFSQELGALLASGLSLQLALNILREQDNQPYLKTAAEQIYTSVLAGESLEQAVRITDYFTEDFQTYISHGEVSGHLDRELIIYSDLLNEQLEATLMKWLSFVQPALFGVLAICILAAYLSILLPVYGMIDLV